MFPRLHYVTDRNVMLCHECRVAFKERGVTILGLRAQLSTEWILKLENMFEKFRCREKRMYHFDAVQYQLGKT